MNMLLARNWWALLIRGVLAVVFGLIAFMNPGITLAALVLLFGAYSLVDGVFSIVAGLRAAQRHERWWPFALEGLLSIVVGIIVFLMPAAAAFALLMLASAWSIVTGLFRIAAAIRLRASRPGGSLPLVVIPPYASGPAWYRDRAMPRVDPITRHPSLYQSSRLVRWVQATHSRAIAAANWRSTST